MAREVAFEVGVHEALAEAPRAVDARELIVIAAGEHRLERTPGGLEHPERAPRAPGSGVLALGRGAAMALAGTSNTSAATVHNDQC